MSFAMIFPGQGSQQIGMLSELANEYPIIQQTFAQASDALGYDMWDLLQNGEQSQINMTEKTQPILLCSSVAIWRLWNELGGEKPMLMAGHSLGEFSALVCADVLDFEAAVKLVEQRGQFMQQAVSVDEGAMAAVIGLDDETIINTCQTVEKETQSCVEAVNFNAPGQVVIAGYVDAVEQAQVACKEAGAKLVKRLPVSAPFHTRLMKVAADQMDVEMSKVEWTAASIPVLHNVHAQVKSADESYQELLYKQTFSPVPWVKCVNTMTEQGAQQFVECGPGKVLQGLNKRINRQLKSVGTDSLATIESALSAVAQ